jgi:hypothetical protein
MKKVVTDSRKGVVLVNGKKIPRLLLSIIKGAVGKSFVVKHYRGGRMVVTRYPDMSKVMASEQQRERRDLFREAVVYAQWIIGDEERKRAFRKTLPRKKRGKVYQAAIQLYMRMQGDNQWLRKQLAVQAVVSSMKDGGVVNGIHDVLPVVKRFANHFLKAWAGSSRSSQCSQCSHSSQICFLRISRE